MNNQGKLKKRTGKKKKSDRMNEHEIEKVEKDRRIDSRTNAQS